MKFYRFKSIKLKVRMSTKETRFLEDLQIAYALAILDIFSTWIHDDDGANDYEAVGRKQSYMVNRNILVVYNPEAKEGWKEKGVILILPSKESGYKFDDVMIRAAYWLLKEVDKKLIESYNSFVRKFGCWIEPVLKDSTMTVEELLSMNKPLSFEKNAIKIHFRMKFLQEGPVTYWTPVELLNWMKTLPAYERYLQEKIAAEWQRMKDWMTEFNRVLVENKQPPIEYSEESLPHGICANTYTFNKLKNDLLNLNNPEREYFKEGNEFIEEWVEKHKNIKDKREFFYATPIPEEKPRLSGRKRRASTVL